MLLEEAIGGKFGELPMKSPISGRKPYLGTILGLFAIVLMVMFWKCFLPNYTLFANDGPLGWLNANSHRMPAMFSGTWEDSNSIGFRGGGSLNLSYTLFMLLGPLAFSKFNAAIALLILGISAFWFFRRLSLAPVASVLGGLAAMLNSGFFSAACWGVATHPLTVAMSFIAMGCLVETQSPRSWLYAVLAGVAVGIGVSEGADIGAIFSLFLAAFIVYQAWIGGGTSHPGSIMLGTGRTLLVAGVAGCIAAQTIALLVSTQIQGIAGTNQDTQTKLQRWDFATQWSLPKSEALGFAIPGLFGYRMDTPNGGNYWGAVGRDPNWDRYFASGKQGPAPRGSMRFSGGGIYTGILVLLIGIWAVLQSFRKRESIFASQTRRWIWFWFAVFVISLLLAFGRFAPFYQVVYALPYFSTIRNPAKFTYFCNWAMVVLFAYGLNGLWRVYVEQPLGKVPGPTWAFGSWWKRVRGFDRRWTLASAGSLGAALVAWLVFISNSDAFERYLQEVQFDASSAHDVSKFSGEQIALFLVFFAAGLALMTLVISGAFRGRRAKWGAVLLGLLLIVDLGRADQPWIITWNYAEKYASNEIIDFLRQQPYEHRVASLPRWLLEVFRVPPQLAEAEQYFQQLYSIEWAQHQFLYYNIQSLDVVQMPRMPEDLAAYEGTFIPQNSAELPKVSRHWQLTNTRYLLGAAAFLDILNGQFDPVNHRFRIVRQFNISPRPEILHPTRLDQLTATPDTNGPFALFEFTGALPRVGLYSRWQVETNAQTTLNELANPAFDPEKTVFVTDTLPASPAPSDTNTFPGELRFTHYAPKDIVLAAKTSIPAVLLLNDRFDPNWRVLVDGEVKTLLHCNYIMRGVYLSAGTHTIEFQFRPSNRAFYFSLCALALCLLSCGILAMSPLSRKQIQADLEHKADCR
jgi:hypothetical protein